MSKPKCTCCDNIINKEKFIKGANKTYFCEQCMIKISRLFNTTQNNDVENKAITVTKEPESEKINIVEHKSPKEIKRRLDEYVVGQENAKKVISVAAYNHYKRTIINKNGSCEVEKSNILMIGPTGTGKTHIIKSLSKILEIPLVIADATTFTEAGYVGSDVESILHSLLHVSNNDLELASKGIIFIDEIDKLAQSKGNDKRTVGTEGVQQALLKMIEGTKVNISVSTKEDGAIKKFITLDTSNILFICGGAFPALEPIILKRIGTDSLESTSLFNKVEDEDLTEFGLIPEFIGRLPIVTFLDNITIDMYKKILTEPRNSILKQYEKLFQHDHINIKFTSDAIEEIAKIASQKKRGARALRTIVENLLQDLMYELCGNYTGEVIINGDFVKGNKKPILENYRRG